MGKRARISQSDLPDQNRVDVLTKIDKVFNTYMQLVEMRKKTANQSERGQLNDKLNDMRKYFQMQLSNLKTIDFSAQREIEATFNAYCDNNYNIYYGKRLQKSVSDKLQAEEIKKITHLIHMAKDDKDRARLQEYIDGKSPSELNALIVHAVKNYQKSRSDYNRQKANAFLNYFHKRIECKPYTHATENEIRATRADFNGFFNIPGEEQLQKYNPYSKAYQEFCARKNRSKSNYSPDMYHLEDCPAWQACQKTTMLGGIGSELRAALAERGIPPEMLKEMKTADFGRVLFDTYSEADYNPVRGNKLQLSEVVPGIESRHKAYFWKNNAIPTPEARQQFTEGLLRHGVSQDYIDVLIPSILEDGNPNPRVDRKNFKGIVPYFTVHHKKAIQYLGGEANNQKNYVAIAEFKKADDFSDETPQHDVWHTADAVIRKASGQLNNGDQLYGNVMRGNETADDFIEYLVDTRYDNQNDGKSWTVSMGYKPEDNIRCDVKDFSVLRQRKNMLKGRSFDKGYRPAAYAR